MGRAVAHGMTAESRFSDPTAFALLPDDAKAQVERFRSGVEPKGLRDRLGYTYLEKQSKVMVARTVAIDDAVSEAASPQLVILGAGLDGRAWRMPELGKTTVFEVDHPDTQREKRERVVALSQVARDVRFTPVDFTRDNLDDALAAAGHDQALVTTWLWEGVVMYLTPADIEATLAVIRRRSASGSRLIIVYHFGWRIREIPDCASSPKTHSFPSRGGGSTKAHVQLFGAALGLELLRWFFDDAVVWRR
jgi:methyltransferase (TIGR00027 family)